MHRTLLPHHDNFDGGRQHHHRHHTPPLEFDVLDGRRPRGDIPTSPLPSTTHDDAQQSSWHRLKCKAYRMSACLLCFLDLYLPQQISLILHDLDLVSASEHHFIIFVSLFRSHRLESGRFFFFTGIDMVLWEITDMMSWNDFIESVNLR